MSMKLVFPGGEHPQVLLGPGVSRVGSDPHANIVLDEPGVLPEHCQLHVTDTSVMLQVPQGTTVSVNGRRVDGLIALRPGDSVTFDHVLARLAAFDAVQASDAATARPHPAANDDAGMTVARPVMPRYVLRGVTGGAFGRSYRLSGPLTVGRSPECDVYLPDPGLSRVHARLVPGDDGVQIEDLDSTNGTFLNGHRVKRETAGVGDEIVFDKVRFQLVGSGAHSHAEGPPATTTSSAVRQRSRWPLAATCALILTAVAVLAARYL